jgi:hypothetical protein
MTGKDKISQGILILSSIHMCHVPFKNPTLGILAAEGIIS